MERNPNQYREKELRKFSMMRFDSATSSFLALFVINHIEKLKVLKSKENFPHFAVKKMFKNIFVSGFLSYNPPERHKKLRWPVMIVKLRKRQNIQKF